MSSMAFSTMVTAATESTTVSIGISTHVKWNLTGVNSSVAFVRRSVMAATVSVIVGVGVRAGGDERDGHLCWRQGWR